MYYLFGFIILGIMYYYFFKFCKLIKEKIKKKLNSSYINLYKVKEK